MNKKIITLVLAIGLYCSELYSQPWVWDEIDEEQGYESEPFPILGLLLLGLIISVVYLWKKFKKELEYRKTKLQDTKVQKRTAKPRKKREKVIVKDAVKEVIKLDPEHTTISADCNDDIIKEEFTIDDSKPYIPKEEDLAIIINYKDEIKKTAVTQSDWNNSIIDWGEHEDEKHELWENGIAKYSQDGIRLLHFYAEEASFKVRNGTKIICDNAFETFRRIDNVIFPESVNCLGNCIFDHVKFGEFIIPKSIQFITGNPFVGCSIRILCSSSFFVIEKEGLYDKEKRVLISMNNSIMFRKQLYLSPDIKIIGRYSFYGMSLLYNTLSIPDGVIYIGDKAFYNSNMDIELPKKLIEIGDSAFERSSLKNVEIPKTVQRIGCRAFYYCEHLEEVILPPNIKIIEREMFSNCVHLKKIIIPEGCVAIREMAFWSCDMLCDVYLPDTLEIIERNAFGNGHLSSAVVSRKTVIEEESFPEGCKIIYRD